MIFNCFLKYFASLAFTGACAYIQCTMKTENEKTPNPNEIEKEIGDFLSRKYGNQVKLVSPFAMPEENRSETDDFSAKKGRGFNTELKPEELIAHLDQYIIKQDMAKKILSTKICTHYNRIRRREQGQIPEITGNIKNNVLMIGPTGVGKTYMIKLIAKKIGVPFVKGDATKFSETGYVGGDVEDLVRDLVREADNDIEAAQCGIIYIDEIDKIASSHNLVGADVSRTGVQRALLKPMEETDVELKVPHDPISMIQEVEQFRKTGKREKRSVNTKNILFIMSGAFGELPEIIRKRTQSQGIGFGAQMSRPADKSEILKATKAEDLIAFGFESEFVGRLPVKAVFSELKENDLLEILRNPNNPVILSKKLDFSTYGVDIKFSDEALKMLARKACQENTGARGLVSVIEEALMDFETHLPSSSIRHFPVTREVIDHPEKTLSDWLNGGGSDLRDAQYNGIIDENQNFIRAFLKQNRKNVVIQYGMPLTDYRIERIAEYYSFHVTEIGNAVNRIKAYYDRIKKLEIDFYNKHDINIVLEEDAVDYLMDGLIVRSADVKAVYEKIVADFEFGLKLIQEKTGRNRFFIPRQALDEPETFLNQIIRSEFNKTNGEIPFSINPINYDSSGNKPL